VTDGGPAAEVDALGLLCPLPILRLRQELARHPPGTLVALASDDEEIVRDLPAFCEGSGHALVSLEEDVRAGRRRWRALVRRG
jgi:tRNA 2-thiouridine synthesizing protein A